MRDLLIIVPTSIVTTLVVQWICRKYWPCFVDGHEWEQSQVKAVELYPRNKCIDPKFETVGYRCKRCGKVEPAPRLGK